MAPVVPKPEKIRSFPDQASFEAWLAGHHDKEDELWLKIHKKGSGLPTVTYAEALDVALCWGWIDGLKKPFDEQSFLQRFSPRKAKSIWSQINREHIARLTAAGRMTPHGQKHVDAAKADGRWDAAYAAGSRMEFPADLLAAIEAEPAAFELFRRLNATNRYALAFRTHNMRTEAGRKKKIESFVEMLKRGETPYPRQGQGHTVTSFVAFLRGVNLGKRQTKSADLKAVFESLGLNGVRTLIASGNVLFEAAAEAALKDRIETALEARFGFAVGVVLRRLEDIRKMVAARPFAGVPPDADVNRYVLFVEPPMEPLPRLVDAPSDWEVAGITPGEIFLIGHRRPNGRYSEGLDDLGKQLPKGLLTTMRNWNTIEKAAAI